MEQLKELNQNLRNKMTEKDYNPEQRQKKIIGKQNKVSKNAPKSVKPVDKVEENKVNVKEDKKETRPEETSDKKAEQKVEEKKTDEKKGTKSIIKKTNAFVNVTNVPISPKHSFAICKFIRGKKIESAINDLKEVALVKKAVPMRGEIPHRKGMMSGRYPKKAAEQFIKILKGLSANANVNGLENPVIFEAIANVAPRPYGQFGRVQRKRAHVRIVAKEKILNGERK